MNSSLLLSSIILMSGVAQAGIIVTKAALDGASESPANASPGTGLATVTLDDLAHTLRVEVSFSGLLAGVTASHIHAPTALPDVGTAPVATQTPSFIGFPSGVTSGTYDHTFDLTDPATYRSAFITSSGGSVADAEAVLIGALTSETAYLNIHSTAFPSGEIRGFLTVVPEPGSTALVAAGLLGGFAIWRKRVPSHNQATA